PFDSTPWFYDAIEKQTTNRPVEALHDIERALELNDNRAVYRSRLQLDRDLAARSASLARIYSDLGFQQLGLVEGWKSVNTVQASGFAGENRTYAGEAVVAGILDRASFSAGGFHFRTDGWRPNADQKDTIANAFVQVELTPSTSVQAEYRYRKTEEGDLQLN